MRLEQGLVLPRGFFYFSARSCKRGRRRAASREGPGRGLLLEMGEAGGAGGQTPLSRRRGGQHRPRAPGGSGEAGFAGPWLPLAPRWTWLGSSSAQGLPVVVPLLRGGLFAG